ncbi:protein DpdD [Chlorobium phaeovibrioides]|uniref:protein DpdD n=1 Tax=Chlorobium phaeovibrioides TaxID=1094 RepID=UPI00123093AB|nr:protein DpdD [Chlorobium phaeovibrioides]QEQ57699.1 hypothetical protein FNV82_09400 [Chlorobium phaeovibrioides]
MKIMDKIPEKELVWLQKFFAEPNELHWGDLSAQNISPNLRALITPWLQRIQDDPFNGVLLLPRVFNGTLAMYGVASNEKHFSQMLDEINAFIGPSFSDFNGRSSSLNPDDPGEGSLIKRFGEHVVRFYPIPSNDSKPLEEAIKLYSSVLLRRPDIPDRTKRPFGRIRSDFDVALLAGNSEGAQALLDELVATGRLNAEQHKCLQVRLLYGLGRVEELARSRMLIASISELSLPRQTLVDVLSALYETFVSPIEEHEYPDICDQFRTHIALPFGSLFRERKGIRKPKVLRAFLLSELCSKDPNHERCRAILSAYPREAEGYDLAQGWFKKAGPLTVRPDDNGQFNRLEPLRQAIDDEDFELAYALCDELLPDIQVYPFLIRCAFELSEAVVTRQVLAVIQDVPDDTRESWTPKTKERLIALKTAESVIKVPRELGWLVWVDKVVASPQDAPSVADLQDMSAKWSVSEYASDAVSCKRLANTLGNAEGVAARRVLFEAFSVLVDFFSSDGDVPPRAFKEIYSVLITILAFADALTEDDLVVANQLTQLVLAGAPTDGEYLDLLQDLSEILKANASQVNFDWGLNLAELLAKHAAPDCGSKRLELFFLVVDMLKAGSHRLSIAQREVLAGLSLDYGCQDILDAFPNPESFNQVVSRNFTGLIGIYTLTEGAAQRARDVLMKLYPSCKVESNDDQVATERLEALARSSDVFVFAWKSSKHQAYHCVKAVRKSDDILLPVGKGSASIISIVERKIASLAMCS